MSCFWNRTLEIANCDEILHSWMSPPLTEQTEISQHSQKNKRPPSPCMRNCIRSHHSEKIKIKIRKQPKNNNSSKHHGSPFHHAIKRGWYLSLTAAIQAPMRPVWPVARMGKKLLWFWKNHCSWNYLIWQWKDRETSLLTATYHSNSSGSRWID